MFEKLIAALPFNPNVAHQLAFYGSRLRREESVRRAGITFILLAFFVQFFALMSPPQPTVANSSNDLINNGISSAADAANHCRRGTQGFNIIMNNYGITCDAIANASTVTLKSTDANRKLYSMGRLPYGKAGEQPINIGGKTFYVRYLWAWDSGAFSTYRALQLKVGTTTYWILYDCGNLVSVGVPTPPPPPPPAPTPCPQNPAITAKDPRCKPCPYNSGILAGDARCKPPVCPLDKTIYVTDARCTVCPYDSKITKTNPKCIKCPNPRYQTVSSSSPQCKFICPQDQTIDRDDPRCKACPYNANVLESDATCKPCDNAAGSANALACVSTRKSAANNTQGLSDATTRMAQAGDVITYTLYADNKGKADLKGYLFTENMSDVLDYAVILDMNGGTLAEDKTIVWPATTVKANSTATKQITVKVMATIPQTPTSSSDPGHFDLVMTNVYGNAVNITLPSTPVKTVETVAASLPKTGPGTTLAVATVIVMLASYLLARTRLLADETKIAIQENATGGF